MAAITQLQLGGWGGKRYGSFVGKIGTSMPGPWCIPLAAVYQAGAVIPYVTPTGALLTNAYQAGAKYENSGCACE